jgi:hypothetical protein
MRIIGTSRERLRQLAAQLAPEVARGRPVLLWSDGIRLMALIGEDGNTLPDLIHEAHFDGYFKPERKEGE